MFVLVVCSVGAVRGPRARPPAYLLRADSGVHTRSFLCWRLRKRDLRFSFGRVNIFEALLRETDSSVRDLLAETLRLVASYDFPDEWPDLIQGVVAQLQTGQVLR